MIARDWVKLILWLILLFVIIRIGIWIYNMKPPIPVQQVNALIPKEKYYDQSISNPNLSLRLGAFQIVQGAGPPMCQKMWYAYRYVRKTDGGYSNFSDWLGPIYSGATPTILNPLCTTSPVVSGNVTTTTTIPTSLSSTMPSASQTPASPTSASTQTTSESQCPTVVMMPPDSCNANAPTVGTMSPLIYNPLTSIYTANLHRFIGDNPPVSQQDLDSSVVVGVLLPGGPSGLSYSWMDSLKNPSTVSQICPGCSS